MPTLESYPVDIIEDKEGAIKIASDKHARTRTSRIDVKHHINFESVDEGKVRIINVESGDQHADVLTKPLDSNYFETHVNALMNVFDNESARK